MKKLKALLAIYLAISLGVTNAQTPPPGTSPNLIFQLPAGQTNPTTSGWTGTNNSYTGTGGGTSGGSQPAYNATNNTLYFGYTTATAAYTYAFSQALQNSGMTITGYNYSWQYINQDYTAGTLSAKLNFAGTGGNSLYSKSWNLGTTTGGWTTFSGTETFTDSLSAANISNFSLSFTGKDSRYWAGYYGPQVKDPSLSLNYTFDQCSSNPLSSPSCPGYAAAYQTQQCNANPLYSTACPGYQAAYTAQQCSANTLYSKDCPGYDQAYLNQQCLKDSLYSNKCEGYATAYAIKYLVNLDPAVTTAVNQQLTTTQETYKNDPARVTIVNTTVDSVLSTPSTTSATSTSPASVTSVIRPPEPPTSSSPTAAATTAAAAPPPPPPPSKQEERAQDQKKTDVEVAKVERKSDGNPERAKRDVGQRAKDISIAAMKAKTIEEQVARQGVLVGLIGYVPGFTAYQTAIIQDTNAMEMARKYSKPVVDNVRAQRRLSGANETRWQEMVDSQYKTEQ